MDKVRFPRSWKVYLPLAVLFVLMVLVLPRSQKLRYDYKKGSPWLYESLITSFDFPLMKTESEFASDLEKAEKDIIPYYKYKEGTVESALRSLRELDFGTKSDVRQTVLSALSKVYGAGVGNLSDDDRDGGMIYVQRGKRAERCPASSVYSVAEAKAVIAGAVSRAFPSVNADSLLNSTGVYDLLIPNLVYDRKTSELVHASTVAEVSTTSGYVSAGTLIVSKGEIVTAEIQQMLDSYKHEYESNYSYAGNAFFMWFGNVLLALIFVVLVFFVINYTNYDLFADTNRYIYLLMIVFLTTVGAVVVNRFHPTLLYMVPFTIAALFLIAFFKKRVVMPIYIVSLLPLLIFAHSGIQLFLMNLFAGIVSIFTFGYFGKGWKQFANAFFVFLAMLFVYLTYGLVYGIEGYISIRIIAYFFLGSFFLVALYPLVYLFEKIFDLVSTSRLVDLTDTSNNPLISELQQKAPGTFQHSLQVMNMCEAAARAIGANAPLVRAGALYHDIGKMTNPQCFIENQAPGCDYHKGLTPQESARDITRHVSDGLSIAEKNRLPKVVSDFILTHHGTTSAGFFYSKYLSSGGDPTDADDFFYHGLRPVSVEQTILMVCDTLEAASRTLADHTKETIDAFVENIFKAKMEAGQFEDSKISLSEMNILKTVLKDYIQQMYHDRIAYPNRKRKSNK